MRRLLPPAWLLLPGLLAAAPLPDPLSLEEALRLADEHHPELALSRAELEAARARRLEEEADDDLEIRALLDAAWIEPPRFSLQQNDDSIARLSLRKRLYDFGRTENAIAAARLGEKSRRRLYEYARQRLRLRVMERFFAVLLADIEFARENEDMAVLYVRLDKAREQNRLGKLSDIDLLELESRYQEVRARRYAAEAKQRFTRQQLALVLGRPDDLPNELQPPLLHNDRELPEYDSLLERVLRDNPELLALRESLKGAAHRLEQARASDRPVITGNVVATHYQREFGSREPFRASLAIEVPLYIGDRPQAEEAAAWAELRRTQALLRQKEYRLREDLLATWQEIQTLRAERERALVETDYRELYLDRSRALYEQEVATDLGDAMVAQTEARLLRLQTEYRLALAWARLDLLTGRLAPATDTDTPSGIQKEDRP